MLAQRQKILALCCSASPCDCWLRHLMPAHHHTQSSSCELHADGKRSRIQIASHNLTKEENNHRYEVSGQSAGLPRLHD